jgi:DNA-binding GntR family transcriptional regulator
MTVGAELANAPLARALKRRIGFPIVRTRLAYRTADDRLIEVAITEYPADSFSLSYQLTQRQPR